jgi:hypothetical protein
MPDQKTLDEYSLNSKKYIEDYESKNPALLYDLARVYFKAGGLTFDIGAGSGRDTRFLKGQGFNCLAVEPVNEFVDFIKTKDPSCKVVIDKLPLLEQLTNNTAENIFCSTVLQHLESQELLSSIHRLVEILKFEGTLLLSWRGSMAEADREGERLFNNFSGRQVCDILISYGCEIQFYQHVFSDASRPDIPFYVIVAKKKSQALVGIAKIQSIIMRDNKTATYKLGLLRALTEIAQTEKFSVRYAGNEVLVPLRKVAKLWTYYYWNFAKDNVKQTSNLNLAINKKLIPLVEKYKLPSPDYYTEYANKEFSALESLIANTIVDQPVYYITESDGASKSQVFSYVEGNSAGRVNGYISVPESIWRDMVLYGHWIEQGILLEWAKMSFGLNNQKKTLGYYVDQLMYDFDSDRDSKVIKSVKSAISEKKLLKIENCTWSQLPLSQKTLAIDHVIPFASNRIEHLWNLVPAHTKINLQKSDKIPTPELLKLRFNEIQKCWAFYNEAYHDRFSRELADGLRIESSDIGHSVALDALIERVTHQVNIRGMEYWSGPK